MTDAQDNKLYLYCIYLIIISVGGGLLIAGIYEVHHSAVLYNTGTIAQGKVQKVEDQSNADADWTTYEVAFVAVDHNTYTIRNHFALADKVKLYEVGQSVPVIYLPYDPEDGRINNSRERFGVYGGCFLGMLLTVLFGALIYYFGGGLKQGDVLKSG